MTAIQKIHDEHRSIAAVLHALKSLARDAQDARVKPRFEVFHAMLHYIDQYPEQLHHPKEDQILFPLVANRAPEAQKLIDSLRTEHKEGARLIRELERSLILFQDSWPAGARKFLETVDAYADFHWKHMHKEEHELMPLAERALSPQDWKVADAAFDANQDPVAGVREKDFQALFSRIVSLAPSPVGVGEPWKKTAR
jgi:hemerythrin-like domain-containing protein